jgi:hypothetical protein
MNFLNPLFLFGLAAAAIPVLIHLFTRRKPREVRFPSLEFLAEVNQSEIRRLRLKQWLLLALRTLAVALLAMAMARPSMKGGSAGRGAAASTLVALVDVSGSMGSPDAEGRPLTATARRVVESLLATLGPADELLLVPYDRAVHPLSEKPLADAARLRAAAQALVPSASATDHAGALELAGRALAQSRALNRELFWISDFQRTGFGGAPAGGGSGLERPQGPWNEARVYIVPLQPRSRANAALTGASLAPSADPTQPPALEVGAVSYDAVSGSSPQDFALEARELSRASDAKGASQDGSPLAPADASLGRGFVSLGARGEGRTLLPLTRAPETGGEVLLPDDALALDNRCVFAAGRSGTLRVVLREDGPPSPLRLALEAGSPASGLTVRALDASQLAGRRRRCRPRGGGRRRAPRGFRDATPARLPPRRRRRAAGAGHARGPRVLERSPAPAGRRHARSRHARCSRCRRGGCCARSRATPCWTASPRDRASRSRRRASRACPYSRRRRTHACCCISTTRTRRWWRRRACSCSPRRSTPRAPTSRSRARSCRSSTRPRACWRAAPPRRLCTRATRGAHPLRPSGGSRTRPVATSR